MNITRTIRPETLPLLGAAFSICFWIVDASLDTFVFKENKLLLVALLAPDALKLLSRCEVVFLLMSFSLLSMVLFRRQVKITRQLHRYKNQLEGIVDERTNDLLLKNKQLEIEIEQRRIIQQELSHLATIDPLTSISNRRKFDEVLSYELMRDERYHNGLSLILFDLDLFKNINDKFGHKTGDNALIELSRLVSESIRDTDVLARWGGEEFVILLPETNMETAIDIAEKLRTDIENHAFPEAGSITASFGVTQYQNGDDESSFIKRADQALYRAKANGRNKVDALPPRHVLHRVYHKKTACINKSQTLVNTNKFPRITKN